MDEILLGEGGKLTPHALLLPSDEAMIVTVARRPEAIGYMVGSGVFSSVKTITVEGEQPSGLARGRAYPLWQSISLITSASPSPAVAALLSYARGRQGQRIVSAWGYGQGGDSR
jgi:ABC-type phosphate transport system substrate-binding protein